MEQSGLKAIVGLGNPGLEYYFTRHNAGFRVVERLGTTFGAHFSIKKDLNCELARVVIDGCAVLLAKPTTYMNRSGQCVLAVVRWYKVVLSELLVVHDDVSLPLGRLRFQRGGGAGGQHGIESIIEWLGGAKDFDRLKIGVGPDPGGSDRADYVLSPVPQADRELFERCLTTAAEAVVLWLGKGTQEAMNCYNGIDLAAEVP